MRYSRKKIFALSLVFVAICLVTSCRVISEVGTSLFGVQSTADWTGSSISWNYDGTWVQKELPNGVRTLNIKTNGAVDVFMAKMNVGDKVLPAASTRYIVSKGILSAENQFSADFPNEFDSYRNALSEIDSLEDVSGISASGIIRKDFAPARDFVPPSLEGLVDISGGGSSALSRSAGNGTGEYLPYQSATSISGTVGNTKNLWVDIPSNKGLGFIEKDPTGSYTKRKATLRAVGTYCYIWVLDSYYTESSSSGSKINSAKAQALEDKFDDMYPLIRKVFGEEADSMIDLYFADVNGNGKYDEGENVVQVIGDIATTSDTGNKVNIVVYDIGGDYTSEQMGGILGYFWSKDYCGDAIASHLGAPYNLTNNGKYFYVDSGFLNQSETMLYSTLAHEFQHMINYGVKTIPSMVTDSVVQSKTWSNEMMSMVCEDMVQEYLNIPDEDSPISRFADFCTGYYKSGLTDWLNGNDVLYSYAGAYAFGAYLARNYGGVDLFKEMATSSYVDQESITQALKKTSTHSDETFGTVFEKYVQALLLDNPPTGVNVPTFKKSVAGIGGGKMRTIDIFNIEVMTSSGKATISPKLFPSDSNYRVDLRPQGFSLHHLGYTNSAGTVQLNFSSPINEDEKIYILVQPKQ